MLILYDLQAQNQTRNLVFGNTRGDPALNNYNLKIGELRVNLSTGMSSRWDSNFNLSGNSNEQVATFSMVPSVAMELYWPISPYAQLSNSVSLGYEYFLEGEDIAENGLIIQDVDESSQSVIDLGLALSNDATITFSNAFSVNITSVSNQRSNGQGREEPFRRFSNATSVEYAQRLATHTQTTFGFSFNNTFTRDATTNQTSVNGSLDFHQHTIFGEISKQVNESFILSLLGRVTEIVYDQELRNDNIQYQIGPGITYIGGPGQRSYFNIRLDKLDFETSNPSLTKENQSTMLTFSGSVSLTQRNLIEHSFNISYTQAPSESTVSTIDAIIPTNFQKKAEFGYNLNYRLNEKLNLNLIYTFSQIDESEDSNQFYRQQIELRLPFRLNERTSVTSRYNNTKTYGSDLIGFNYNQHVFDISLRLDF